MLLPDCTRLDFLPRSTKLCALKPTRLSSAGSRDTSTEIAYLQQSNLPHTIPSSSCMWFVPVSTCFEIAQSQIAPSSEGASLVAGFTATVSETGCFMSGSYNGFNYSEHMFLSIINLMHAMSGSNRHASSVATMAPQIFEHERRSTSVKPLTLHRCCICSWHDTLLLASLPACCRSRLPPSNHLIRRGSPVQVCASVRSSFSNPCGPLKTRT